MQDEHPIHHAALTFPPATAPLLSHSACSRETDNQGPDADVNMDVTWQGKLHEQQQHSLQHGLGSGGNPAAAAARSLSGGAFDPSALQWGLGAAGLGLSAPPEAAAAAASQMLSALGPAQVLALLSNPLYLGECHHGCFCLCFRAAAITVSFAAGVHVSGVLVCTCLWRCACWMDLTRGYLQSTP